jgi:hypothetical protein
MSDTKFHVGQKVIVSSRFSLHGEISFVEKITPTGKIRIKGSDRLFSPTGRSHRHGEYSSTWISAPSDEKILEIEKRKLVWILKNFDYGTLSISQLESIKDITNERTN